MGAKLATSLRRRLIEVDDHCCAYCQSCSDNTGQPLSVDHIIPAAQGGSTEFDNLCFCCRQCNEFKGANTAGLDPVTGNELPLFHPRRDSWEEHLTWDGSNSRLVGLTATGRATVVTLNMNNDIIVLARQRWVSAGWHPPQD
jgi:hypothetical protein